MKVIRVAEDLCHGCGACSVACHDGAITEKPVILGHVLTFQTPDGNTIIESRMKTGGMTPVPVIKAALKQIKAGSLNVILDAPPGTSCPFVTTVAAADYVILVTEPTPFGLSDLIQSIETLRQMNKPFGVIINRAGLGNACVHEYLLKQQIPLLLEIPFDKKIAETYSNGRILVEIRKEFGDQLRSVFNQINEHHGDRSHQR
jgi:MinD superfamily P-loop ATPase